MLVLVSPKVVSPVPFVRFRPRLELVCRAIGTLPIYMAVIRNSKTLVNTSNTARFQIKEEGNFTCRASSKYGTDERTFIVVLGGKRSSILISLADLAFLMIYRGFPVK